MQLVMQFEWGVRARWRHALCHANIASMIQDRLERAAAFVTQLHRISAKSPHSWRRVKASAVTSALRMRTSNKRSGTPKRPVSSIVADDAGLIILTAAGGPSQ
jgi:hypothetical protein